MVCESCGEKPKNTAKDFTKAVIEINNPETLILLRKVVIPASMGDETNVPVTIGKYHNVVLQYEVNNHIYLYSSDGIPTAITGEIPPEVLDSITELENDVDDLQNQIDDLKNSPDVVDIVATYAALQSYDTSKLGDNDIVRVLQDETHDGQSTYYRWNKQSSTWTYIGAVGDYYTKGQVDTLLADKQNELTAGSNIAITQSGDDLVISATDTTYSNFVGTDGVTAGSAGLVPAPATTDAGKFLNADGSWEVAGGGVTPVQTTGTSTTDVMSQDATTSMVFADPANQAKIRIGNTSTVGANSLSIGVGSTSINQYTVSVGDVAQSKQIGSTSLGYGAETSGAYGVSLGYAARSGAPYSFALPFSSATEQGVVQFGLIPAQATNGYNNSQYRLLSGLYDPVNAHDAATKGYVDGLITMTDTDPGEGSPLAANNFIGVYGGNPVILDYATSEINTGTKWINGDTIYKKTVSVGNLPNATMATTAHNISNFATLVKLEGSFTNGSNSAPIPYASPTTTKCVQAYADATNITIVTGEDRSAYSGYVTLYYTKSS